MQEIAKAFFYGLLSGSLCQEAESQGQRIREVIEADRKEKEAVAKTDQKRLGKIKLGALIFQSEREEDQTQFYCYVNEGELESKGFNGFEKGGSYREKENADEKEKGDGD